MHRAGRGDTVPSLSQDVLAAWSSPSFEETATKKLRVNPLGSKQSSAIMLEGSGQGGEDYASLGEHRSGFSALRVLWALASYLFPGGSLGPPQPPAASCAERPLGPSGSTAEVAPGTADPGEVNKEKSKRMGTRRKGTCPQGARLSL